MQKLTYALEPGGPKRLEVSWNAMWKEFTVRVDDRVVGRVSGQKELREGKQFRLKDRSTLSVRLQNKLTGVELEILHDGQPLPGTSADPATRLKNAYGIVFFVAGLNIVLGSVAVLFEAPFLQALGIGFYSILFGLVFLVLGFFVKRKFQFALLLAIVVFALDSILGVIFAMTSGVTPSAGGLLARILLIIPMIQGIPAMCALKQHAEESSLLSQG
jgi:hypothetical protein